MISILFYLFTVIYRLLMFMQCPSVAQCEPQPQQHPEARERQGRHLQQQERSNTEPDPSQSVRRLQTDRLCVTQSLQECRTVFVCSGL